MAESYELSNRFATVDGIRLHYALDGTPDQPVLALVNMASHNLTCWEVVLDGLLTSYRVLRFDIRGTGKSDRGDDDEFSFSRYADDLAGLMDVLQIPHAFVLGVAYGARTAARFALRHPERLTGLGLFDVALTPPVAQPRQRALGAEARRLLADAGMTMPPVRKSWRYYENRESARLAHTAHERETDPTGLLGNLTAPVLIGCGRQDANLQEARRIAAVIPGSEFHIMEMTGHGSPFFRPDLFVELVCGFADRLLRPAAEC